MGLGLLWVPIIYAAIATTSIIVKPIVRGYSETRYGKQWTEDDHSFYYVGTFFWPLLAGLFPLVLLCMGFEEYIAKPIHRKMIKLGQWIANRHKLKEGSEQLKQEVNRVLLTGHIVGSGPVIGCPECDDDPCVNHSR